MIGRIWRTPLKPLEDPDRTWTLEELEQGTDLKADALER